MMYPVSILQLKLITCWYSYEYDGTDEEAKQCQEVSQCEPCQRENVFILPEKRQREMEVVFKKMDPISTQFKVNQIKEAVNKANVPAQFCRKGKSSKLKT